MAYSRDLPKMAVMDDHGLSQTFNDDHGLSWTRMDQNGLAWTSMDNSNNLGMDGQTDIGTC